MLHVASPLPPARPQARGRADRAGARRRAARAARRARCRRQARGADLLVRGDRLWPSRRRRRRSTRRTGPTSTATTCAPYAKSKTLAERAAWDFIASEGGGLELSVVNPVGVFGPVLGPDYSTSILLVQRLMDGAMPGCPRLYFGVVDVRDVADLHSAP